MHRDVAASHSCSQSRSARRNATAYSRVCPSHSAVSRTPCPKEKSLKKFLKKVSKNFQKIFQNIFKKFFKTFYVVKVGKKSFSWEETFSYCPVLWNLRLPNRCGKLPGRRRSKPRNGGNFAPHCRVCWCWLPPSADPTLRPLPPWTRLKRVVYGRRCRYRPDSHPDHEKQASKKYW